MTEEQFRRFGGTAFARAVARCFGTVDLPDTVEVGAWLLDTHDVEVRCSRSRHRLTIGHDGRVVAHDHQFGDLDSELMLAALSADPPACLAVVSVMERAHMPGTFHDRPFERTWSWVACARAWAADGRAFYPDDRAAFIQSRTYPDAWARWEPTGLAPKQVRQFLIEGATPEQALPWIREGMTDGPAAKAAARGESPPADFAASAESGFSGH